MVSETTFAGLECTDFGVSRVGSGIGNLWPRRGETTNVKSNDCGAWSKARTSNEDIAMKLPIATVALVLTAGTAFTQAQMTGVSA